MPHINPIPDTTLASKLLGTWELISFENHALEPGVQVDALPFGSNPKGQIMFSTDGSVSVLITSAQRHAVTGTQQIAQLQQAHLYQSMMAYAGKYIILDESHVRFDIELAWNVVWEKEQQQRKITFIEDKLVIDVGPQMGIHGVLIQAKLIWQRMRK